MTEVEEWLVREINKVRDGVDNLPSWPRRSCGYRPSKPTEYL